MKTTINIDEDLLHEAMKISSARTKTEAIEIGLKEIIAAHKRKELANLFGSQKNLSIPEKAPV